MTPNELDECFEFVSNLVKKCGEMLIEGFKDCGEVMSKGDEHEIVTVYDKRIEEFLMTKIGEKYPSHKFVGEEEQSVASVQSSLTSSPTWIIDPIDGTINFVKHLHFICISVALVIDGDLKMGFLYNPTLNEYYTARKGQGAFLNGHQIHVSQSKQIRGSLIGHEISIGSVAFCRPLYIAQAQKILEKSLGIRSLGSAALTLGYVAKGAIDAYSANYLKPWDIAAGALIVREAGGVVIDINGGDYNIMKPDIIAAASMEMAIEIKEDFAEVVRKLEDEGNMTWQLAEKEKINKHS